MEEVILVDIEDNAIGSMEKLKAHQEGVLHRAFSVLIFNDQGEMMLQQRAHHKYHSGGLWTNTCCSHPRPSETVIDAANRRLEEEMGMSTPVNFGFKFIYKAALDHDLTEYELDHVLLGKFNGTPIINSEEVADWKWITIANLKTDISTNPQKYTIWFLDIVNNRRLYHVLNELANT